MSSPNNTEVVYPGQIHEGTHYIYYPTNTQKETIVFVHGVGSYYAHFDVLISYYREQGYGILAYDLIGRGYSAYPQDNIETSFDGDAHVNQLRNLITHLGLQNGPKYHIIGHSMGGAITTLYASQFSSEIISITLLAPAGLMNMGPISLIRCCCSCFQGIVKSILLKNQEKAWRQDFVSTSEEGMKMQNDFVDNLHAISKMNPNHFESFWQSVLQFPFAHIDEAVRTVVNSDISVLLLFGSADKAVPSNPSYPRWCHLLQDGTVSRPSRLITTKLYDNMGHAFFLEISKNVISDINEFYEGIDKLPSTDPLPTTRSL
jgi:pimeloyl-ACP methyl ester carboxylesterase